MGEQSGQYECVIRRRDRMATAIVACGAMEWDDEKKGYLFAWPVPEDHKPNPLLMVEIDVFEGDERVGFSRPLRWVYGGQTVPVVYPGPGQDDDPAPERDEPKPPSIALDFDPDELLRVPVMAMAGAR